MTAASPAGTLSDSGGIGSSIIAVQSRYRFSPRKGRVPDAISYNRTPRDQISLRGPVSLPSSCSGDMFGIVTLGQAKIEDFRVTRRRHNHVRRLQVAMHNAALVRVFQGAGDLPPVSQQRFHRNPAIA